MEAIYTFNCHILLLISQIVFFVLLMMVVLLTHYHEWVESETQHFYEDPLLEFLWTAIPGLILGSILVPSLNVLYFFEDPYIIPDITLKVVGHQWYWHYEINTTYKLNKSCIGKPLSIKFSSYMVPTSVLKTLPGSGFLRLLETNKRLLLPIVTTIRVLVSSVDVLHSWSVPSFGIKIDACPGRLNQVFLYVKRAGLFFGQCSEICGVNHGFMPLVVNGAKLQVFRNILEGQSST